MGPGERRMRFKCAEKEKLVDGSQEGVIENTQREESLLHTITKEMG